MQQPTANLINSSVADPIFTIRILTKKIKDLMPEEFEKLRHYGTD